MSRELLSRLDTIAEVILACQWQRKCAHLRNAYPLRTKSGLKGRKFIKLKLFIIDIERKKEQISRQSVEGLLES